MTASPITLHRNVDDQSAATKFAYVGVLLFVLVYCARPNDWIPGAAHIPFAKIVGFFALAAFVLSLGSIRQRLPQEVIYLLLLFTQLCLTVAFSPVWRGGAFDRTLEFSKVVLITLVMSLAVTTLPRLRRLIFVQTSAVAVIAAASVLRGDLVTGRLEAAVSGDFGNPNDLSLAIAMNVPFAAAFAFRTGKRLRKVAWVLIAIMLAYASFRTASRSGFISLLVAIGVCLWEFAIKGRRRSALILAGIAGLMLWSFSNGRLQERFEGISSPEREGHGSAEQREQLLWRSIEVTLEHPLFGVGPGNFTSISGVWKVTHNSYTQMSSEGGIPAFILYVLILLLAFANVRSVKRRTRIQEHRIFAGALHASLAAFAVGSFFASVAYQFFPYFLVCYTTALVQVTKALEPLPSQATQRKVEAKAYDGPYGQGTKSEAPRSFF